MLTEIDNIRNEVMTLGKEDWSFIGATYYSMTVVTTIGESQSRLLWLPFNNPPLCP